MGWFKSAEEKAAEKRKKELVEKYGEKDGLRIFENKITEEKYLEEKEKEKKETAQKKHEAKKQKVLDYYKKKKKEKGCAFENQAFFEDNPNKEDYDDAKEVAEYGEYPMNAMKFFQLAKELVEEGKLFTADTWKGEALDDWMINGMRDYSCISVFTKSYAEERIAEEKEEQKKNQKWKNLIIDLLTKKSIKMTISDITAHIKHDDRDEVKRLLEEMNKDGDIDFGGSGRYFILSEEKKKPKKTSAPKSKEVDVEKELEKYKGLLDKGLITQEEYDAKRKQILGL